MADPNVGIKSRENDYWRRGVRSLVQFIAGGGLTVLFDQLIKDIPDRYDMYVVVLSGALVSVTQNYCEDQGWIPALLKSKPSAGVDPVP